MSKFYIGYNDFDTYVSQSIEAISEDILSKVDRDSFVFAKDPGCKYIRDEIKTIMLNTIINNLKESLKNGI